MKERIPLDTASLVGLGHAASKICQSDMADLSAGQVRCRMGLGTLGRLGALPPSQLSESLANIVVLLENVSCCDSVSSCKSGWSSRHKDGGGWYVEIHG